MAYLAKIEIDVMPIEPPVPYTPPAKLNVVKGQQLRSGTALVSGFIPAGLLLGHYEIPYYNHTTKRGYQRPPQPARINALAAEIKKDRVDLPTAILLNIRSKSALNHIHDGEFSVEELLSSGKISGRLFYVVDGQHRILAFERAVEDWRKGMDFLIPFTCMIGADESEEMSQFYTVNSTSKAVKTDLAYALLKKRSETEDGLIEALQERGRDWQVIGQTIVERLATDSLIWRSRIRLPGMDASGTIIPSASMVSSLKPVLSSPFFSRLKIDQQVRVLDAFWEAVRDVLRDAFEDPSEYAVQKGVGVMVLHVLLPEVLEVVRDRGDSTTEPASYEDLLTPALTELEGENRHGKAVTGPAFWQAGTEGAAGTYSSSAGRRVLVAKLRSLLPTLEVD